VTSQSLFKPKRKKIHEEEVEKEEDLQTFLIKKIKQTKERSDPVELDKSE